MKFEYKELTFSAMVSFLSLLPMKTYAESPSYDFISFEYANRVIEGIIESPLGSGVNLTDGSFDGFALAGSIEIYDRWFAELRYLQYEGERETDAHTYPASSFGPMPIGAATGTIINTIDPEVTSGSGSVGYQAYQGEDSSLYLALGFAYARYDVVEHYSTIFRDDVGNIVYPAPNTWVSSSASGGVSDSGALITVGYRENLGSHMQYGIRFEDVFFNGSSTSIAGELLYKFAETLALQVATELASDETQFSIGLRYIL